MSTFLPEDYEMPTESNYMKFEEGPNKFRILASPIIGWEDWDNDKKVYRYPMNAKPAQSKKTGGKIKHFWAFPVWNYKAKKVQILELTQASIQKSIKDLALNEDWGDPKEYDITVNRTGQMLDTEYSVVPSPSKKLTEEIMEQHEGTPINLNALFSGEDPFVPVLPVEEQEA